MSDPPTQTAGRNGVPAVAREYEAASVKWMSDSIRDIAARLHPLLRSAKYSTTELPDQQHVAKRDRDAGGSAQDFKGYGVRHEWIASYDTILDFNTDAFLAELFRAAEVYGSQVTKELISFISETAQNHGNVVQVNLDRDLWDSYIEALELIEIDFDDQGNHSTSLLMNPQTEERMRESPPTQQQQQRIDEIMFRKRRESDARRGRRRIS